MDQGFQGHVSAAQVREEGADDVTFVITGITDDREGDEDRSCADYIAEILTDGAPDRRAYVERALNSACGQWFVDSEKPQYRLRGPGTGDRHRSVRLRHAGEPRRRVADCQAGKIRRVCTSGPAWRTRPCPWKTLTTSSCWPGISRRPAAFLWMSWASRMATGRPSHSTDIGSIWATARWSMWPRTGVISTSAITCRAGSADNATGSIDHIAFEATGLKAMIARLEKHGIAAHHRKVPDLDPAPGIRPRPERRSHRIELSCTRRGGGEPHLLETVARQERPLHMTGQSRFRLSRLSESDAQHVEMWKKPRRSP